MTAILKVDTIQDTAGNNIINESSDTITIGASGDTVTIPGTEVKSNKLSPASGTALQIGDSGDTITIPSGATIANSGTATGFGGGKILQVQNMTSTTTTTTTSNSFVVTALTDTITPSATSSKILILATGNLNNTGASNWTYGTIARGGTNLGAGVGMVGVYATGDIHSAGTISYLDAPNSTSELTYDYRIKVSGGTGNFNQQTGKIFHELKTTNFYGFKLL